MFWLVAIALVARFEDRRTGQRGADERAVIVLVSVVGALVDFTFGAGCDLLTDKTPDGRDGLSCRAAERGRPVRGNANGSLPSAQNGIFGGLRERCRVLGGREVRVLTFFDSVSL